MRKSILLHIAMAGTLTLSTLFGLNPSASADSIPSNQMASIASLPGSEEQTSLGNRLIKTGKRYLGVPYLLGAEYETSRRFDCSSFTQYVFGKNGIDLARGARQQYKNGKPVARKNLRVGDLVFFSTTATVKYRAGTINRIGHVGIYAGNNNFLHTYGKGGVQYTNFSKGWWNQHYVGAVRVVK